MILSIDKILPAIQKARESRFENEREIVLNPAILKYAEDIVRRLEKAKTFEDKVVVTASMFVIMMQIGMHIQQQ